jgi:hypothetical protein
MTEIGRVAGVFYEPGKVFADLAERPRWIVPILISILLGMSFVYAVNTHVGWEQIVRQQIAASPRAADLPADQREQAIARGAKFASVIGWVGAVLGPPFFVLIIAGILTGLFNALLGTDLKFFTMFCITCYAMLVRAVYSILLIVIMFLKPPEDFNIRISPFSPAGYMSVQDTPKWLMALAGSLDLFTIWTIVLLAIGFSVASRKIAFSKALIAIGVPWLVWVVAMMGLASFQ